MVGLVASLVALSGRFARAEDGVATVDWVILTGAATATAIVFANVTRDDLTDYSRGVRQEVQSPYFETSWTEALSIPPEEFWGQPEPSVP